MVVVQLMFLNMSKKGSFKDDMLYGPNL